jgi:hypothetical protein
MESGDVHYVGLDVSLDDAYPKAGAIAEFHLRWNQLGIGPSSHAGRGEDCFLDFDLGEIGDPLLHPPEF